MNQYLFFSDEYIEKLKKANGPEYLEIKSYLEALIEKDDKDIFHPFCVACDIENKYHKFAWHLLACEMKLFSLSILWLINPQIKYISKVEKILSYLIDLPYWSDNYHRFNRTINTYPETAAIMRGFAVVGDILGNSIGENLYLKLRKRLSFACQRLYEIITKKEEKFLSDFTDDWSVDLGVALGSSAIYLRDFDNRSSLWQETATQLIKGFLDNLPEDGSHRNGLLRWEYSLFNVYIYIHVLKVIKGEDLRFHPSLAKIKHFALNCSDALCSNTSQFDQSINIKIYNPLNGILSKLLADIYDDDFIYWGIKNSPKKKYYHPMEIFYADNEREIKTPKNISSLSYSNAGYVFLRSGRSKNDNFISFKSRGNIKGYSHKDQNNMEIFLGDKEMLIESGTCYSGHPNYEMRYYGTHAHNVILIDNKPQLPKGNGKGGLKLFKTNEKYDLVQGDASGVYSKAKIYLRNLLFIKPNFLILYDYILLNSVGDIEWLFHTPGTIHVHSLSKLKSILFTNQDQNMSMFILTPENWSYRLTKDYVLNNWETMHEKTHDVLRVKSTYKKEFNFISLFHLGSDDHEVLPCSFENNIMTGKLNNTTYKISFTKGEINIIEE